MRMLKGICFAGTLPQTGELEMPKPEESMTRMERLRRYVLGRPMAEVNGAASSPVQARRSIKTPTKKRGVAGAGSSS